MARNDGTVGVISDTHGLLRPEATAALAGVDLIIHAGDIGALEVIEALRGIAPVVAVRGNVDSQPWADEFPDENVAEIGGRHLYVRHNLDELDLDPAAAGFDCVITGHSHCPKAETKAGVLYLNPGSAGPRRFTLPIALALLRIEGGALRPDIVVLEP
jgi:putative phosphoesterase